MFQRFGEVLGLHLKLQDGAVLVIRTTGEHPFYRYNGQWQDWNDGQPGAWTAAFDLREGDAVLCHNGQWAVVQELHATGDWELVYNLRVAKDHTYFVGDVGASAAVWVHNAYLDTVRRIQFTSSDALIAVVIQHRQDTGVSAGRNVAVARVTLPGYIVEYWSAQSGGKEVRKYAVLADGSVIFRGLITGIDTEIDEMTSLTTGGHLTVPHSESVLLAGLNKVGRNTNQSLLLTDFYTEYAPCGSLSGSHECSTRLDLWSRCGRRERWSRPETIQVNTRTVKYSQFYPDTSPSTPGRVGHRRFHTAISRAIASNNIVRADLLGQHYFQHPLVAAEDLEHDIHAIPGIGNNINFPLP